MNFSHLCPLPLFHPPFLTGTFLLKHPLIFMPPFIYGLFYNPLEIQWGKFDLGLQWLIRSFHL